ncbi:carboxylesterase family protein [Nocardia sp. CDC159]|uniref:Carboxylic ester hydrolase n=1 Tax=Nocardia pulmonis TaxID=2951408 RepID=A0A9X2J137_9NOCA|nr:MULTISPECIES: carboxylesterase/lipase family protein [Nocardia]MCM6778479.1 carboxylesterase family protein [Nocardia pulmonis]MCM6791368.1 carboxylesterase family protein [Nocardia sp. CDC159]
MRTGVFRRLRAAVAVGLLICAAAGCGSAEGSGRGAESVVTIRDGQVRGQVADDHRLFAGIPYAAAPVGERRWQPPAAPAAWSGQRDATTPGPQCPQTGSQDQPGWSQSEDCLSLNVWTPAAARERSRLPVLVWIHGGSFLTGSGRDYTPIGLVNAGNMVVVTINYRLGALGFLAHPALAHDGGQVGNFGLLDQQAALRWVRDNIGAFGGDPAKVTLAGESAGAMSVCDHLASPASVGLFRAAVLQSGPCQVQADRATAIAASQDYAARLGCDGEPAAVAACLRAVPVARLLDAPLGFVGRGDDLVPGPVTGEALLPANPVEAIHGGQTAKVPVLIGFTHDEGTSFTADSYLKNPQTFTADNYPNLLAGLVGPRAGEVAARYPLRVYPHPVLALSAVGTDRDFVCPILDMADGLAKAAPVYAYEFADAHAAVPPEWSGLPFPLGAAHALELPYLFDRVEGLPAPPTSDQRALSQQMIRYWAAFVNATDPAVGDQPAWPRYTAQRALQFAPGDTKVTTDAASEHRCQFWNTFR